MVKIYGNFDNSCKLVRLILRRERIISTFWVVIVTLFSIMLAPAIQNMFTEEARFTLAETLKNPGMIAMMGPVYGADNYTIGAMYSNMMLLWLIITVAVMNVMLVTRHTRTDEEKGRIEVVRSLPTGRLANLNAVMVAALIINSAIALLTGFGLAVMGIESMGFEGSMLYGVAIGLSGLLFASITALFAQLSSSSRGTSGYSFLALGIMYMMRAAGDMNSEILSLISPLGLIQRSQVYVLNNWLPVLILLIETAILAIIAYVLNTIRDIDQSFILAKPGRKEASPFLRSPFGLAFRLLRNSLLAWLITIFALGASYGAIMGDIEAFIAESKFYQMIIGVNDDYSMIEMFTTMVNSMMSLICIVPILITVMKPRSEEKDERAEHVLSRVVSRPKYLASYAVPAFISGLLFQCATAIGLYISSASVLEEPVAFDFLMKASLVYLPAMWVMTGLAILLFGLLPRFSGVIWVYYGFSFFSAFFGRVLELPEWLPKLSPFGYIPQLPVEEINYVTLAALTVIATLLTVAGFVFYKKRDMRYA